MTILQRWKQTALHNKALVLTGLIVALGTVFGTGAVIVQVCLMQRNNRQTSEQIAQIIQAANVQASAARQIADASNRNVEAANKFSASAEGINTHTANAVGEFHRLADSSEKSIGRSQEAFKNEQRAWIGVSMGGVNYSTTPSTLLIYLSNSGRTPAFNVSEITYKNSSVYGGDTLSYEVPITQEPSTKGTLPPGFPLGVTYEIKVVPPRDVVSMGSLKFVIIYSGKITYDDAFKRPHWTQYCFYATGFVSGLSNIRINFCPYGNDTDDSPTEPPKVGAAIHFP
jgi:hypothetical protein